MNLPDIVLASASPRRRHLLQDLGFDFEVIPSNVSETASEELSPHEICRLNAFFKARTVAVQHPRALVIGVDTLVFVDDRRLGKPATHEEARSMLGLLQGQTHTVVSGVCLLHAKSARQKTFTVATQVRFHPLSQSEIDRYLEEINPLDKAGGYAIQEKGDTLVESIEGSFSNVVGLPIEVLQEMLREFEAPGTRVPEAELKAG